LKIKIYGPVEDRAFSCVPVMLTPVVTIGLPVFEIVLSSGTQNSMYVPV
jgi:hypothetical protein